VLSELNKAFKVDFFQPQNLSNSQLRFYLGLEINDEPIPEGVYLIKDDLGLGGIYVEGIVEEMILAIDQEYQIISFQINNKSWILKYNPIIKKTYFTSPEEMISYDLIPIGILIISGKVNSLGGGIIGSSGDVILVKDLEVPSILQGVQLTIISSNTIKISSHLIRQGAQQQEGVAFLKDTAPQLSLFSTGKNFWDETTNEGGIIIAENSPAEINIQATLTASGNGFIIEGFGIKVNLLGSLQTDYETNENTLNLTFDNPWLRSNTFPENIPSTKEPVLFVSFFKFLSWQEH